MRTVVLGVGAYNPGTAETMFDLSGKDARFERWRHTISHRVRNHSKSGARLY